MRNRIENVILTRMDEPIDELSLGFNEHKVMEYWKVSYNGLEIIEHSRGEMQRYREIINGINSINRNESKEIIISF